MPSFDQIRVPLGFAVVAVYLLWTKRGDIAETFGLAWTYLKSWFHRRTVTTTTVTNVTNSDVPALEAFAVLKDRFKGNPEAMKALRTVWPFFLDDSAGV